MMTGGHGTGVVSGDIGLVVFALIGLLGGAHCLGMCGPLVTLYADRLGDDGPVAWAEIRQHLLFNFGRTVSYALLGALMGLLGTIVYDTAAVVALADSFRAVAGIAVGGFIMVTGGLYLRTGTATSAIAGVGSGSLLWRFSTRLHKHVDQWVGGPRIIALGAVHGILPCPLLYPAFLYAFAIGSPAYGALALSVLGLGTVPAVFGYGVAFNSVSPRFQSRLHRALGVVFLVLGYLPLSHGLLIFGLTVPHPSVPIYQPLG
ncbi:sulfite exporter TauE/SafE family protein [Haloarcula sp. Atlit-120R]|uniref:sulfite exporter TauE/SafE family protein n=1 Tax=Haloarcula sp. Atlit-120R TaxID=2282135 RepID=UPI000EF201BC|nr:sulfite exporter TauE/SafE family protein [Haloarcula sp. Atlit-120R]RLM34766.1 sulfite exporter TauE/SafE family protein [Haloarcula sp. Atlit-120R]